jgi:hypothetical protein
VIHHRQRLTLGFETRHHLAAVHAQLEDLESDAAFHRLPLLGHPDFAETALTDFLQQLVTPDARQSAEKYPWSPPAAPV